MQADVKFAVEVEVGDKKKSVLVLNLDPLVSRIGGVSNAIKSA